MLNIVIPMAGLGQRFAAKGYHLPKPLIPIHNIPMIKVAVNNLRPQQDHRFIFICQMAHVQKYGLDRTLSQWIPGSEVIALGELTNGAACTVLTARDLIDNDQELMIVNSDQYIEVDIGKYLEKLHTAELDGLIMTMKSNNPQWSFVDVSDQGRVVCVAEKQVISDEATVGVYSFKKGKDFISGAEEMIRKNIRVNNEFYVAPVFNILIESGKQIGIYNVGKDGDGMYGLGTPEDLEIFMSLPISLKAVKMVK